VAIFTSISSLLMLRASVFVVLSFASLRLAMLV